jgi:hypothetical protein
LPGESVATTADSRIGPRTQEKYGEAVGGFEAVVQAAE